MRGCRLVWIACGFVVADREDLGFTYSLIDRVFRLSLGERRSTKVRLGRRSPESALNVAGLRGRATSQFWRSSVCEHARGRERCGRDSRPANETPPSYLRGRETCPPRSPVPHGPRG